MLTLAITLVAGRLTGISTGLTEPIVVRSLAGFLAAGITSRTTGDQGRTATPIDPLHPKLVCPRPARHAARHDDSA